jgi:hypothetical protein
MSTLTYLVDAQVSSALTELDGKTLTRPTLLVTDMSNVIYAVDVDIGQTNPLRNVPVTNINKELSYADVGCAVRLRRSTSGRFEVTGFSKRMPGTYTSTPVTLPKYKLAPQLVYGGVTAVAASGSTIVGTPMPKGTTTKVVPFGDFPLYGGFGTVPFGAIAMFVGGVFQELI